MLEELGASVDELGLEGVLFLRKLIHTFMGVIELRIILGDIRLNDGQGSITNLGFKQKFTRN